MRFIRGDDIRSKAARRPTCNPASHAQPRRDLSSRELRGSDLRKPASAEADGRDLDSLSSELARGDHVPSLVSKSAFALFTADIAFGQPT
jgi:hypothetical protein